jgi:PAS domain S-box-containing protein
MSLPINKSNEQEGAEAEVEAFANALGPFVVAAETSRIAMVFTNAQVSGNPIIFVNNAFLGLTGYDREEVLGRSFESLMKRGIDSEALPLINAAFDTRADADPEIRYRRKDGSQFWASVRISPVRDRSSEVVQHFVSLIDLTRHKEDQQNSRMLIDELNHRVKNTLATVQSIVRQSLRSGSNLKAIGEAVESRLSALARSHDLLTQQKWEGAGLLDMVNATLRPFIPQGRPERFDATGENIRIPPTAVLALNITFHELVTNALKYGSFSNDIGHVSIGWKIVTTSEGDRLHLHWRETEGPPVSQPSHRGFGSVIIESGLAYQLNGVVKLDFPVEGVVCTIDIPAPTIPHREE